MSQALSSSSIHCLIYSLQLLLDVGIGVISLILFGNKTKTWEINNWFISYG